MQQGQSAACRYMTCALVAGALVACGGDELVSTESSAPATVFPGIDGVSATVNGETLLPTSDGQYLAAAIELPPGAPFEVLATCKEVTYRAAGTQYENFAELVTPGVDAVWDRNSPLLVTWNGTPRNAGSLQYFTSGIWPPHRAPQPRRTRCRSRLNLVASAHRDILVTDGEEF